MLPLFAAIDEDAPGVLAGAPQEELLAKFARGFSF